MINRFDPIWEGHQKDTNTINKYLLITSRLYTIAIVVTSFFVRIFLTNFKSSEIMSGILLVSFMITSALLVYNFSLYRELASVLVIEKLRKIMFFIWLIIFFLFNIFQIITLFVNYGWWMVVLNIIWGIVGDLLINKVIKKN
ncbi:MAG: hypothetical protein WC070_00585 [Candidatus Magasanikbacteria bacterium]